MAEAKSIKGPGAGQLHGSLPTSSQRKAEITRRLRKREQKDEKCQEREPNAVLVLFVLKKYLSIQLDGEKANQSAVMT